MLSLFFITISTSLFCGNQTYLNDQESWGDAFDGSIRPYGAIVNNIQQYKSYKAQPSNIEDFMR